MKFSICIVDDDLNLLDSLRRTIRKERPQWDVTTYSEPTEVIKTLDKSPASLYLSDYKMGGMTGVEFLIEVKARCPNSVRVLFSGMATDDALQDAINDAQVFRFIAKPIARADLVTTLDQAQVHFQISEQNRILLEEIAEKKHELLKKDRELESLKNSNPELFKIERDEDGAIVIGNEEF